MNLGKSDCIAEKYLRDSIESHKLDIGYSGYLFYNNFPPLTKCTSNSWITNTWIPGPMQRPTSLRTPTKHTKIYSLWPLLSSRSQKRITLRYTRVQTYTGPNEPREKRLHSRKVSKRLHRIPQTRYRLLRISILQ